jgi:hypothetical protein
MTIMDRYVVFVKANGSCAWCHKAVALLIDALADPKEALGLFRAIETMPPIRKKAAWAQKYLDPSKKFAERLLDFI